MRYSRQILFSKIGKKGQELLNKSHVTIVGAGALGTSTAELLTRAGIGKLTIIDRDIIELNNLQRQSLYLEEDIDKPKAEVIKKRLKQINSEVEINSYVEDLDHTNMDLIKSDLILDCTDNIETRQLINEYSIKNNVPWIYSSVIGSSGYILDIIPKETPCFNCLFNHVNPELLGSCETEGILNTTVKLISSIQTTEAIKILTKQDYSKELLYYDIWNNRLNKLKIKRDLGCIICNKNQFPYLNGEKKTDLIKICGRGLYQIRGKKLDLKQFKNKIKGSTLTDYGLTTNKIIVFNSGRTFIKANSKEEAKTIYSKFIGN